MTRFATTRWSLILRAASEDDHEAQLALAVLCESYWYPVYAYIRRLGCSPEDAEDMTQGYFARFLEKQVVRDVHPARGRFRSFLLASARNYVNNERDRARAEKRGGRRLVSLDTQAAERQLAGRTDERTTPDAFFERIWAETMVTRVHQRLEEEAGRRGGRARLQALRPLLPPAEGEPIFAALAQEWGVKEGAVRVALHRLRNRFAEILREEIARTVERPSEIEDEGRRLLRALAS